MADDMRDPVLDAIVSELRTTDAVNPAVVARVVRAAVDARDADLRDDVLRGDALPPRRLRTRWRAAIIVGLSAAAGVAGFMLRGVATSPGQRAAVAASAATRTGSATIAPLTPVSASDRESMAVPTQFVLENRGAHRVALVGDFNGWNPSETPMTRHDGSALWAVMIPLSPGRHLYAFMVDDSSFTLDPRTSRARDKDVGATASVVIVGRP